MACLASKWLTEEEPLPLRSQKMYPQLLTGAQKTSRNPSAALRCHWPLPPSPSSRQPLRQWSSLPNAPWDCSSSYSWSKKSRLLLLGNPRMVNLWDTLVHCSRFAATLSYSSVAPGNSSESNLEGQRNRDYTWAKTQRRFHVIQYTSRCLLPQTETQEKIFTFIF